MASTAIRSPKRLVTSTASTARTSLIPRTLGRGFETKMRRAVAAAQASGAHLVGVRQRPHLAVDRVVARAVDHRLADRAERPRLLLVRRRRLAVQLDGGRAEVPHE